MQQGNKTAVAVIGAGVLLVAAAVLAFVFMAPKSSAPTSDQIETKTEETTEKKSADTATNTSITIVYTNSGFSPNSYTVKAGSTVKVENKSSSSLQFSSADHPTHREETELNLAAVEPGGSITFTPTKTGTWGFHDHLNASNTGTLIVE